MIDDRGFQVALDARSAGRSKDEPQGSNCYVAMSTSILVHISLMPPTAMTNFIKMNEIFLCQKVLLGMASRDLTISISYYTGRR